MMNTQRFSFFARWDEGVILFFLLPYYALFTRYPPSRYMDMETRLLPDSIDFWVLDICCILIGIMLIYRTVTFEKDRITVKIAGYQIKSVLWSDVREVWVDDWSTKQGQIYMIYISKKEHISQFVRDIETLISGLKILYTKEIYTYLCTKTSVCQRAISEEKDLNIPELAIPFTDENYRNLISEEKRLRENTILSCVVPILCTFYIRAFGYGGFVVNAALCIIPLLIVIIYENKYFKRLDTLQRWFFKYWIMQDEKICKEDYNGSDSK